MAKQSNGGRLPARSPEERENELINLAVGLAEKQLRDGTASPSVLTHYLKLATSREALEQERLRNENVMLQAKAEALATSARTEELYDAAVKAFTTYKSTTDDDD